MKIFSEKLKTFESSNSIFKRFFIFTKKHTDNTDFTDLNGFFGAFYTFKCEFGIIIVKKSV
ncbi:MAG: hypothetical protein EAZ44_10485 [Cytophagia bacterium]|nr:MAG: hypothetical protein EAY69_02780 [Cytophagales bacterium]TAF99231.1 MAG: hypothetical protein EAZ44_10485 [Cytophagia bacterium]TAG46171.1 MAG: hypothetical protein EAZ31_00695 [Cytophagia bacterium]TAH28484.1 MAG: hypothetical protein EAZ06_09900 [Cytophagales bacterium]